jgi:hypothetical protein
MSGFVEKIRMKLFIKILLFVFVTFFTNVKVTSEIIPFTNIQKVAASYSFHIIDSYQKLISKSLKMMKQIVVKMDMIY